MKIIFSRKGVDKSDGGIASPIFPDGGMRSLPIPAAWDQKHAPAPKHQVRYKHLSYGSVNVGKLVEDLTFDSQRRKSRIKSGNLCIFSPDLIRSDRARPAGWLPLLGQSGAALTHLFSHGIRPGDLFLFFGWFHKVCAEGRHFRFDPDRQDAHVIFGWLQVGQIWCRFDPHAYLPKWAKHHQQVQGEIDEFYDLARPDGAIFIAKRHLDLPGIKHRIPGGGVFQAYDKDLCLSSMGKGRSHWRVPGWMYPFPKRKPLGYHEAKARWKIGKRGAFLHTVGRGQEFVLDLDSPEWPQKYPVGKVYRWLASLFRHAP